MSKNASLDLSLYQASHKRVYSGPTCQPTNKPATNKTTNETLKIITTIIFLSGLSGLPYKTAPALV